MRGAYSSRFTGLKDSFPRAARGSAAPPNLDSAKPNHVGEGARATWLVRYDGRGRRHPSRVQRDEIVKGDML